jgi:hypothetical protein
MLSFRLLLVFTFLVACHRPKEVRGLYLSQDGAGVFFPCDDSTMVIHVPDSGLSTSYHNLAGSTTQPLFVRLRGVQRDSGSIYGGKHFLEVREVIEIRARTTGECPGVAQTSPSLQPGS